LEKEAGMGTTASNFDSPTVNAAAAPTVDKSRRRRFYCVSAALIGLLALVPWLIHSRIPRPLDLPRMPADPAVLSKFSRLPTGWDSKTPYWFLGNLSAPHRWENDWSTGLCWHTQTDLYVGDTIPLVLTRTFLSQDNQSRAFGIGTTDSFDIFLVGNSHPFTYLELILQNGRRIFYHRVNPGLGYKGAVYRHDAAPGEERNIFLGSTIRWDANRWDLILFDGTILNFPDSGGKSRSAQAALTRVTTRNGETLEIVRDPMGNVLRVTSPNGAWLTFTHDAVNRVTSASDSLGHTLTYSYDLRGRLQNVKDPSGGVTQYHYDDRDLMRAIIKPDGTTWLRNACDAYRRLTSERMYGQTTTYKYYLDPDGRVKATDIVSYDGRVDHYEQLQRDRDSSYPVTEPQQSSSIFISATTKEPVID
jgi:YD repeat-containing protein